jgi:hypothetical protein
LLRLSSVSGWWSRRLPPGPRLPPSFVDERTIKLLPDGAKPAPGALYELTIAKTAKVLRIGIAAWRDLIDFLRHDTSLGNPAGPGIHAALALGISQSGGYLRDFIGQGFNQPAAHRRVFDGVLTHIAGVGRVFLNDEFGSAGAPQHAARGSAGERVPGLDGEARGSRYGQEGIAAIRSSSK